MLQDSCVTFKMCDEEDIEALMAHTPVHLKTFGLSLSHRRYPLKPIGRLSFKNFLWTDWVIIRDILSGRVRSEESLTFLVQQKSGTTKPETVGRKICVSSLFVCSAAKKKIRE